MRAFSLAALIVVQMLASMTARTQWVSGQNADLVLGQKDFTGNTPGLADDSLTYPDRGGHRPDNRKTLPC